MTIDVYTSTGTKKGTTTLPKTMFEAPVNEGLMHQFMVMQQGNRRQAIAHTKTRGEISGSSKKLFQQKGTGRARRGSSRANILRGGNKSFGPRSDRNFRTTMPRKMRRAALLSALSKQANAGVMLGLEGYGDDVKTKSFQSLLTKLSLSIGRKTLFVLPEKHKGIEMSARNIPGVKTILVGYLNVEDILSSYHIVFVGDALKKSESLFAPAKVAPAPKKESTTSIDATPTKETPASTSA